MKKYNYLKFSSLALLALTVCVLSACQTSQNYIDGIKKTSDLEEMDLKGPIKTVKIKNFRGSKNLKTNEIIKKGLLKSANSKNESFSYNKHGNITEKVTYDSDEQVNRKWTYEYNEEKDQVIERVYKKTEEEPIFRRVNYYDENGNRTKLLGYSQGDDDPHKETFSYDKNGNILEEINYVNAGPLKTLYEYDDNGNLIKLSQFRADTPIMTQTYEYDNKGNLVGSKQDEGRTVHASYKHERKYEDGKEVENKVYKDGELDATYFYSYNEQGNQVEFKKYGTNKKVLFNKKTAYKYDKNNNWIQKAPLNRRGIPEYITEREIEYFNE